MSSHVYVIEGVPRSGKNSTRQAVNRRTGRRFVLKSKAATEWLSSAEAQLIVQRGRRRPLAGPVQVELVAYQRADVCDVDNIASLVLDGLKGIVIEDDKAVRVLIAHKLIDRVRPRVEVTIRLLEAA